MKKLILVIIIFLLILIVIPEKKENTRKIKSKEERAIFISYIELEEYVKGKDNTTSKKNIDTMIDNIDKFHFNMIILQVRSFSDAIYNSKIFPWSSTISDKEGINPGYDVLNYFIKKAHQRHIELHAWINPYRIRSLQNNQEISEKNKAYTWQNTNNVKNLPTGIYYNPASEDVKKLILSGVEELVNNYNIDGIHYDDYFYPSNDIDNDNYNEYKKNHDITLSDYHLEQVNDLIKRTHKITKLHHITFGISPSGNISNNYNSNYADVYNWGKSDLYVDYLMPQIYYGFKNESEPFFEVLNSWDQLVSTSHVKILPALAMYKINKQDNYAKGGIDEWINEDNIIMKQVLISRNIKSYGGFGIFRYDFIFNNQDNSSTTMNEINNLKKVIIN